MEAKTKADVLCRLTSLEGHLRAVKRMVEDERPCPQIVQQARALQGSLRQVTLLLVASHLDHCLAEDAGTDQDTDRQQMRQELMVLFQWESAQL